MNAKVFEELEQLHEELGSGLLKPEAVVDFARKNPKSALHECFTWDDTEAAKQWRLSQARRIIRVCVIQLPQFEHHVKAFVSVPSDRNAGDGYRDVSSVMSAPLQRAQVIEEAMKRISKIRMSYSFLPELMPLFDAIDQMIEQHRLAIQKPPRAARSKARSAKRA